ncbi:MAG TPA: NADH-quinone oxidoreductase subunit L, partial [Isosphaeraceae bacterium]
MTWQVGLYVATVLIPLAAFVVEILGGRWLKRNNALVATGAIGLSFVLSLVGFLDYFLIEARSEVFAGHAEIAQEEAAAETKRLEEGHAAPAPAAEHEAKPGHTRKMPPKPVTWKASFPWVAIGEDATPNRIVPQLEIPIGVHIDNVTVI